MALNQNHELDLEFIQKHYPITDEQRRELEKQFDKEEEGLRDIVASRTMEQKQRIAEAINILFMDDMMAEF